MGITSFAIAGSNAANLFLYSVNLFNNSVPLFGVFPFKKNLVVELKSWSLYSSLPSFTFNPASCFNPVFKDSTYAYISSDNFCASFAFGAHIAALSEVLGSSNFFCSDLIMSVFFF